MTSTRRYRFEFGAVMAAYAVAVVVSVLLLQREAIEDSAWRVPVALLPVPPGFAAVWVIVRHLRGLDEYWQRVQLEALPFAFFGTMLAAFTWGFLENAGVPRGSPSSCLPSRAGSTSSRCCT